MEGIGWAAGAPRLVGEAKAAISEPSIHFDHQQQYCLISSYLVSSHILIFSSLTFSSSLAELSQSKNSTIQNWREGQSTLQSNLESCRVVTQAAIIGNSPEASLRIIASSMCFILIRTRRKWIFPKTISCIDSRINNTSSVDMQGKTIVESRGRWSAGDEKDSRWREGQQVTRRIAGDEKDSWWREG